MDTAGQASGKSGLIKNERNTKLSNKTGIVPGNDCVKKNYANLRVADNIWLDL
jgi:hypothetical protein